MEKNRVLAQLAAEYWKLLKSFERAAERCPIEDRERLTAQIKYSANRLDTLLAEADMKVLSFDGMSFEINLPAVAINGDELKSVAHAVVERTIEPAVLLGNNVLLQARVFLTAG